MAAILAGIIILSVVFFYFNVSYPSGPLKITPPPIKPKNVTKLGYLFDPQYAEPLSMRNLSFGTGPSAINNFTLEKNGTTIVSGTVYNKSNGAPIENSLLYVFAAPVYTIAATRSNGSYSFQVMIIGKMNFTFDVLGYKQLVLPVDPNGNTIHLNIYLSPEKRLNWHGITEYANGTHAPDVTIHADGFLGGLISTSRSNLSSEFSFNLYEDSYQLTVIAPGLNTLPKPPEIELKSNTLQNLTVSSITNHYNLSGYVRNRANNTPVPGAFVFDQQDNAQAYSNVSGYYTISVVNSLNRLITSHAGFFTNVSIVDIQGQPNSLHDIYLEPLNPFLNNSTGYYGNSSSVSQLNNNTSSALYNQTGKFILTGTVTVNGTNLPVSNTTLLFLTNLNGSVYYDRVATNATGHYETTFYYKGHYVFLIKSALYQDRMLYVNITNPVNYRNFTLVPKSSDTIVVTGHTINSVYGTPVNGAAVTALFAQNNLSVGSKLTNKSGFFSFLLVKGNYTFVASAYGYQTNYTGVYDFTANASVIINLTPLQSLPSSSSPCLKLMGTALYYGLPDLTPAQISAMLSGSGNVTSNSMFNLTLHFNSTLSVPIGNTPFVVYFRVLGGMYYANGTTNSNGVAHISCIPQGSYEILPEMFYYSGNVLNVTVNSNMTVWLTMSQKQLLSGSIHLINVFNSSKAINSSTPVRSLALTDSILPMPASVSKTSSYTAFSFNGYTGVFDFNYTNIHFLPASFNITFTTRAVTLTENLTSYEISLAGNTAGSWNYSVTGIVQSASSPAGVSDYYYLAEQGSYSVTATLTAYPYPYSYKLTLTASSPEQTVYFNESAKVNNLTLASPVFFNTTYTMLNYSGSFSSGSLIYGGVINIVVPLNTEIFYKNVLQQTNYAQGTNTTTFALNKFLKSSSSTFELSIYVPSGSNLNFKSLEVLEVFYYQVSLK